MGQRVRYIIKDREQSPQAEAFRALCASILNEGVSGKIQSVLFTSASDGDGGAMVAVNTAATLAYTGKRVVLVDCDLRRPILSAGFGLDNVGLTDMIQGDADIEDVIQDSWVPNLKVVASGPTPLGPLSVLSNRKTRILLEYLRNLTDIVILTSSPLVFQENHVISDACVLASKVDGVVLVLDSQKVKPKIARKAIALLNGAKANIIGTVLNDVIGYSDMAFRME